MVLTRAQLDYFSKKEYFEEYYLKHGTSLVVAVIVALKSIFFNFKATIIERWNNNKITAITI